MATPYQHIPDDLKKNTVAESGGSAGGGAPKKKKTQKPENKKEPKITGAEKKQHRIFKKKRAGVVLSKDEVKAIKAGRRKLRREMRSRGIKSKREFELTAGSLGLYFDKAHGFWAWIFSHWLGTLIGLSLAMLGVLFIFSTVQQMRGHFTINLSDGLFKEGYTLSEYVDFEYPSIQLFATPAQDVPCISINQIPIDIDEIDGEHNDQYFAYTFYIRNDGENTMGYEWLLQINSESKNLSDAAWIILFEDGEMRIYAKANIHTGEKEALPPYDSSWRGYLPFPLMEVAPESDQFEVARQDGQITYYRVVPDTFVSDRTVARGTQEHIVPGDVHKYTVVMYLEGDDESATNDVIGGNLGVEMNFRLFGEKNDEDDAKNGWQNFWKDIWSGLMFWE